MATPNARNFQRELVYGDSNGGYIPFGETAAKSISIPADASGLSAEVDLCGLYVQAIVMSAQWTAAALSFSGSETSGGTFSNFYKSDGNEYSLTVAAGNRVMVPSTDRLGGCFIKVRSGLAGAIVQQGGVRALTLLVRPL